MTIISRARQEITTKGNKLFVAVGLSALMAVPALARDSTRIEVHVGPSGATIERRDPDGWRERTDIRVNLYDGQVYRDEREGYYGRNRNLRNGDAPQAVEPREDSWGQLVCPQGYDLEANILGKVNCIRVDRDRHHHREDRYER
ncbi:MAG: hypothetical protein WC612_07480 [Bdellovibrionales bacterium]|jgi:hypothetical protein